MLYVMNHPCQKRSANVWFMNQKVENLNLSFCKFPSSINESIIGGPGGDGAPVEAEHPLDDKKDVVLSCEAC